MSGHYRLFGKTELRITNLIMKDVNLSLVAAAVATALGLPNESVLVVDVRDDHIALDILEDTVEADKLYGRKKALFEELEKVAGLQLTPATDIRSNGILGSLVMNEEGREAVLQSAAASTEDILARLRKKAIVFPTGFEVKNGMIKDTNTPYIIEVLKEQGYKTAAGEILDDDLDLIAGRMLRSVEEGYGLVITTGGVGAEDKDKTVEAALKVDPEAATPYLVKFEAGKGRHVKDGIRICVAQLEFACIICLPGPNDEVQLALPVIIDGLAKGHNKEKLSLDIVTALQEKYKKLHHRHGHE